MADGDLALVAGVPWKALHSFTVDDYHRMAEVGILPGGDRVELIEGVVVSMSPIGPAHFAVTLRLDRLLKAALGERATVSVQGPVRMVPRSEPEPDIAVLRRSPDDYERELPGPLDVLLLVEVADSTLAKDRDVKAPLYARHSISEYWLLDVAGREALVHRVPLAAEGRYGSVERVGIDGTLEMAALSDVRIALSDLFRSEAN
jgi:Uma2 family endonuclease